MRISQRFLELSLHKQKLPEEYLGYLPMEKTPDLSPDHLTKQSYKSIDNFVRISTLHSCLNPKLSPQKYTAGSPIILVFCQPGEELKQDYPYVPVSYCSWLESAGARCVPLPWNLTQNTMQYLIQHSNGILVPGGNSNLYKIYSSKQGIGNVTSGFKKVWKILGRMWEKGIHYPIWGTCLGFQLILLMISGDMKILNSLNSKNHALNIFTFYEESSIFSNTPLQTRVNLENKKLMNFTHVNGLAMDRFLFSEDCEKLRKQLKLISGAKDKSDDWFCAYLEGRHHPIFISQFHPQKQSYEWNPNAIINHNYQAIQASQYLANHFVQQCRRNPNRFPSAQQQTYSLIYNYIPQFDINCKYFQIYLIDFKFKKKSQVKNPRTIRTSSVKQGPKKNPEIKTFK